MWIKDRKPEPYKLVNILMDNGLIHQDMMIKAKYGNLVWRNWNDKHVAGWKDITDGRNR